MSDPRIEQFAKTICNAIDVVDDDVVLVLANERAMQLILELQTEILQRGAYPELRIMFDEMKYILLKHGQQKHMSRFPPGLAREIEVATKLVSIECVINPYLLKRVPPEKVSVWQRTAEPYYRRLDFVPTVVTIFPNIHYANQAGLSLEEYEDLFYNAVSVDIDDLYQEYYPVEQMLSRGKKFAIHTSNSDISFELGGRPFTMNALLSNLPAGELFCSPLESSLHGYIRFEHPAYYQGKIFKNIYLKFNHGMLAEVRSDSEQAELEKLLHMDDGANKIGEFGFGLNPEIRELTNDILFDEKVAGTFHIAFGDSHPEVGGTNRSVIHFDLIKDMRGDGNVTMDGRVVYREGAFCTC
jgi:aminopeptidase